MSVRFLVPSVLAGVGTPKGTTAVLNAANEVAVAPSRRALRFDHIRGQPNFGRRSPSSRIRWTCWRWTAARCQRQQRWPRSGALTDCFVQELSHADRCCLFRGPRPLIAIHEYGHYRVAVACGVKVLRFSVGFGKPLLHLEAGQGLATGVRHWCSLWGFVRMLDEQRPGGSSKRHRRSTPSAALACAIVAAGPLANLLLAVLLYSAVNWGWACREPCHLSAQSPVRWRTRLVWRGRAGTPRRRRATTSRYRAFLRRPALGADPRRPGRTCAPGRRRPPTVPPRSGDGSVSRVDAAMPMPSSSAHRHPPLDPPIRDRRVDRWPAAALLSDSGLRGRRRGAPRWPTNVVDGSSCAS